jgi:hypothetical protein
MVPAPKPKRRSSSELNLGQVRLVQRAKQVCLAAQKPDYAATLQAKGISAQFVTSLLEDIDAAERKCSQAVQCTTTKESATRSGQATEQTLVRSLRDLQTAARQLHQHSAPEKLQDYLIGERITDSKEVLDQSAQTIISKANEERPPGVDTQVIQQVEAQRQAYAQARQTQATEQSRAQTERATRDALVDSIRQRCQQSQFAADRAWPVGHPAQAGVRREFRLPATRPYTG